MFKCDQCSFSSSKRYNLKRHIKNIHDNYSQKEKGIKRNHYPEQCERSITSWGWAGPSSVQAGTKLNMVDLANFWVTTSMAFVLWSIDNNSIRFSKFWLILYILLALSFFQSLSGWIRGGGQLLGSTHLDWKHLFGFLTTI